MTPRRRARLVVVAGVVLLAGPLAGLAGTLAAAAAAFAEIDASEGRVDARRLERWLALARWTTVVGVVALAAGVALVVVGTRRLRAAPAPDPDR